MINKKAKKIIILLFIIILLINLISPSIVMASQTQEIINSLSSSVNSNTQSTNSGTIPIIPSTDSSAQQRENEEALKDGDAGVMDGIAGVLTWIFRWVAVMISKAIFWLTTSVAGSAGTIENPNTTISHVTPEDILFNKIAITDINFFSMGTFGLTNQSLSGSNNPIKILKENIAAWYMTIRTIAIIISVVVLIYIGIRMAIASTGEDKGKYKQLLKDWFVGLCLLFILHYIMILVIQGNNVLVNMIYSVGVNGDGAMNQAYMTALYDKSLSSQFVIGWGSTLVYFSIAIITAVYLVMYIKRMIMVAFLVIISPIITITYAIDKVKDNTSNAFNAWIKEFFVNVLIQPFHCILYVALVSVALSVLNKTGTLGSAVIAVITLAFTLKGEGYIKSIFGLNNAATGNGSATALALMAGGIALGKKATSLGSKKIKQNKTPVSNKTNGNKNAERNIQNAQNPSSTNTNTKESNNRDEYSKYANVSKGQMGDFGEDNNDIFSDSPNKYANVSHGQMGNFEEDNNPTINTSNENVAQNKKDKEFVPVNTVQGNADLNNDKKMTNTDKLIGYMKTGAKWTGKAAYKGLQYGAGATGAALAATAATIGDQSLENIAIAGYAGFKAGKAATLYTGNKIEDTISYVNKKHANYNLSSAYEDYKGESNSPVDVEDEISKAQDYLSMQQSDIDNIKDEKEKNYVKKLHDLRKTMEKESEGTASDADTLNELEKIIVNYDKNH